MRIIYFLMLILGVLLITCFAMLNAQLVPINYFIGQVKLPLALALFLAFCFGALIACAMLSGSMLRAALRSRRLQSKVQSKERELSALQNNRDGT